MFALCNKGFQITFTNGLTASIMFGRGNYCSNRYDKSAVLSNDKDILYSNTVEIVVLRDTDMLFCDGSYLRDQLPQSDCGWKGSDDIAKALPVIASFPSNVSKKEVIETLNRLFSDSREESVAKTVRNS